MDINKRVSDGFRIANLIATILVVAIHYNSKMYILPSEMGQVNYLIQEYITNGVARIAVPFFAFSSGVFFFRNYDGIKSYQKNCRKRFWSLVVPYLFGGGIILFSDTLIVSVINGEKFNLILSEYFRLVVINPYVYQLWFIRDIIVLSIFSPLIIFLTKYTKGFYIVLLMVLWFLNYNIFPKILDFYIVNIETLFFFSLGCFVIINKYAFDTLLGLRSKILIRSLFIVALLLFAVRVSANHCYLNAEAVVFSIPDLFQAFCQKTAIVIGVYVLIAISSELRSEKLIYFSGFTFFVYIYHARPLFRFVLKSGSFFIQDRYLFYYGYPVATISTFLLAFILNRYFPRVYMLMAGGRCPQVILEGEKT